MYNSYSQERYELIHEVEQKRGVKIITIIGNSVASRIDARTSREVIRNIRKIGDVDLDILLHTIGGDYQPGWDIARTILYRSGRTNAVIPHKSKSIGTLISISSNNIITCNSAEFGPFNPSIRREGSKGPYFTPSQKLLESPDPDLRERANEIFTLARRHLREILINRYGSEEKYDEIVESLVPHDPELPHSFRISPDLLMTYGFNVDINNDYILDYEQIYEAYFQDPILNSFNKRTCIVEMITI